MVRFDGKWTALWVRLWRDWLQIVPLVTDVKRRRVLKFHFAPIINTRGGDVGVAQSFLHLSNVRLVIERIRGGRSAECVRTDLEAQC